MYELITNSKRIIVFGTVEDMKHVCATTVVAMDGTFNVSRMVYQLFNIHSFPLSLTGSLPELFCLLPDKTGTTYSRLFMLLKSKAEELGLAFYPNVLLVDFEQIIGMLNVYERKKCPSWDMV